MNDDFEEEDIDLDEDCESLNACNSDYFNPWINRPYDRK